MLKLQNMIISTETFSPWAVIWLFLENEKNKATSLLVVNSNNFSVEVFICRVVIPLTMLFDLTYRKQSFKTSLLAISYIYYL